MREVAWVGFAVLLLFCAPANALLYRQGDCVAFKSTVAVMLQGQTLPVAAAPLYIDTVGVDGYLAHYIGQPATPHVPLGGNYVDTNAVKVQCVIP